MSEGTENHIVCVGAVYIDTILTYVLTLCNNPTLFKRKTKHLRAYIKIKAYKVSSLIAT